MTTLKNGKDKKQLSEKEKEINNEKLQPELDMYRNERSEDNLLVILEKMKKLQFGPQNFSLSENEEKLFNYYWAKDNGKENEVKDELQTIPSN